METKTTEGDILPALNVSVFISKQLNIELATRHSTVPPRSIDPSSRGQTSSLPRARPRVHRGEKDFYTRQNRGVVYRGKFAAGEKTRHAAVKKNRFCLMKFFNPS